MASKRHVRKKQCEGKACYRTKQEAQLAVKAYQRDFGSQWVKCYSCSFCGKFHFGHFK